MTYTTEIYTEPAASRYGLGHLDFKDSALCLMSAHFLELAERHGIKTNYRGLINQNYETNNLNNTDLPTRLLSVRLYTNQIRPLEFNYYNKIIANSPLQHLLESGKLHFTELGLKEKPKNREYLKIPYFEIYDKETEKYYPITKARTDSLSQQELNEISEILMALNELATSEYKKVKLINDRGSVQLEFDEVRRLMLLNTFGTPETTTLSYKDTNINQELESNPKLKEMFYQSLCNELTQKPFFQVPNLEDILKEITKNQ